MPNVFKSITRLVYYSNGGFSFGELYSEVPVYVRRFLVKEIENIKKKEKEAIEEDSSSSSSAPPDDIGEVMEKMQKGQGQSDKQVEKNLEQVFGPKEERGNPDRTRVEDYMDKPPSQRRPLHEQKSEESDVPEEQKSDGDPAKAKDLEQMIDKLKKDM